MEGKRPPSNDAAALGTRVHAILEKWLKDGTAPDTWTPEGEIAASGLHLLPAPRTPTLVTEEPFHFTSQRAWYTGFKDFRYRAADDLIHVGDHKTTKSFTWAKSLEEILCHSQALIYAVDEFHKNPNDDRLALDWIYYKTTGSRKAELRSQVVSRNVVAEMFFEHVDPVAGEITKLHHEVPSGASALDFTPDFRACEAFGGCAFLSICNPTPTQRVQATMTQAGLSLADKLKSMNAGRPPSPIHPPEAFTPAPPLQAAPASYVQAAPPVQAAPAPFLSLPVPNGAAPTFNPVAAPVLQAAPVPQAGPVGAPVPQAAPVAAPVPQAAPAPVLVLQAAPDAPKPRGRPKRKDPALVTVPAPVSATAPVTNGSVGFTLYIGCAPIGVEVSNARDYVNAARDHLKATPGAYYGRNDLSPSVLCEALEALFVLCKETGNAPSGDVLLGDTQMEQDTSSVWLSKASKVVRSFR